MDRRGFSLLETLLYLGIFAVVGGALFGILTNVVRVSTHEISGDEVSSQLQFAMGTITRLVKDSSSIEISTSTATTTLKLRMPVAAQDPTCITLVNGVLKLAQGPIDSTPGSVGASQCTSTTTDLTTDKVVVDSALFKRIEFPGGHDQVAVDMQFSNTATGANKISRALRSGISRASAATFDSDLLPNATNQYEVGSSIGKKWKNISLSGLLNVGTSNGAPAITAQTGSIYYDTGTNSFKGYNGTSWNDLGSSLWIATSTGMYSNVSGYIGVGTQAPIAKIHVYGSSGLSADSQIRIASDYGNGNLGGGLLLTHNHGAGSLPLSGDRLGYLIYGSTNGVSPLNTAAISAFADGAWATTTPVNYGTYLKFETTAINASGRGEVMRIASNGNVGIGTQTPTLARLDVSQNSGVSPGSAIKFGAQGFLVSPSTIISDNAYWNGTGWGNVNNAASTMINLSTGQIEFSTAAAGPTPTWQSRMVVANGGNIGIGVASPAYKLDVGGSINGAQICINGSCQSSWPSFTNHFGGLYQTYGAICSVANPQTGGCSCPGGYSALGWFQGVAGYFVYACQL